MFSLKNTLENASIDCIYSSPFLRTLQTVAPFAGNNHPVNIEYGLAEGLFDPVFESGGSFQLNTFPCRVNETYESTVDRNNYVFPESTSRMRERVHMFCDRLTEMHHDSHDSVLLVTHKCICNTLLARLIGAPRDLEDDFGMGQLACVENGALRWVN